MRRGIHKNGEDPLDPKSRRREPWTTLPSSSAIPSGTSLVPSLHVSPPSATEAARAGVSLEDLLPAFVRRIAWSGDGRKGTVRMELGAGALAGATLILRADDGRVRVQLDAPPGADTAAWRERIERRLAARGIETESVEVT
jgi:hypothetical protein